jgi:hypothetical protein
MESDTWTPIHGDHLIRSTTTGVAHERDGAPWGAGFDLSIRGAGQASGGARARRGNNSQDFVAQASNEGYVDDDG